MSDFHLLQLTKLLLDSTELNQILPCDVPQLLRGGGVCPLKRRKTCKLILGIATTTKTRRIV